MATVKFEVFTGIGAKVHFRIYGKSGKVVVTSQGFQHKEACMDGIRTVKENARVDGLFKKKGEAGKFAWALKAPNHKTVLEGGPYATVELRDEAISQIRLSSQAAVMDKA